MNHIHVLVYEWPVLKLLPIYTRTIDFFLKLIIYICLYTNIHAVCIVYEYIVFSIALKYIKETGNMGTLSAHTTGGSSGAWARPTLPAVRV